jgi:uncharacterized protein
VSAAAPPPSVAAPALTPPALAPLVAVLGELAEDLSVPRNVRRGAQAAIADLARPGAAVDVRIASAVYRLDELANDPNLPLHARTALWSLISQLERMS